ncbi:tungstate ABC transporter substrate-binding protein WtpA [Staphylothermus hellenicus]|uniref:Extracellular solute-binding protein family 1 n=1 Tax=Staphylothermus hellenicus (strain DSM 12710 / JCM 10830 / BK20S6-10-b1 / P8) TaxID=591019 RepID=D7DBW8_STAHD|nr:tungstate ABC transporter substrate-binding protein WtpA [Staphylothermus hellenicus]ADI31665.1 extracellular solute-binding protein family 1 [Staphylothermus hellenicus DSM 12710]
MDKLKTSIIIIVLIIASLTGYYYYAHTANTSKIIIFTAGSLKIPLDETASKYREKYGVNIYIEASGSVEAIRKVTDLGREADIIAVADYRLIPKFLVPNHTSWYIGFATNQVVLIYTDKSKYHEILENNPSEWYRILMRNNVKWGFSDPNKDPCGYRSVGIIGLASIYYNDTSILENLLLNKTNIEVERVNDTLDLIVPADLRVRENSNLIIRSKSVDLISLVEAGTIDYAFEYLSVAVQHHLKYIRLPDQINLGNPEYGDFYGKVIVKILVGTDKEKSLAMSPIIYGVTVLDNAPNRSEALKFLEFLLGYTGREIFEENGQPYLEKFIVYGEVPEELGSIVGSGS